MRSVYCFPWHKSGLLLSNRMDCGVTTPDWRLTNGRSTHVQLSDALLRQYSDANAGSSRRYSINRASIIHTERKGDKEKRKQKDSSCLAEEILSHEVFRRALAPLCLKTLVTCLMLAFV